MGLSIEGERRLASTLVMTVGSLWGLYWLPVRAVSHGPWGSLALTLAALVLLMPAAILRRHRLAALPAHAYLWLMLGGASFVLYSVGLVYGQVATVILMFYLTPVWSTLITRFWLGWPIAPLRYAVIVLGLVGLLLVLGAEGGVPMPRGVGDWLGLASGFLWAVAATGMRGAPMPGVAAGAFVFVGGAFLGSILLSLWLAPWPTLPPVAVWGVSLVRLGVIGGLWWALAMVALLWATARLDPTRVGILLMSEVLMGVISAALLAGEPFGPVAALGAVLVVGAAALELWPEGGAARRKGAP